MKYKGRNLRHEIKYLINRSEYIRLKSRLASIIKTDSHTIDGAYHIRSLYFDDIYNRAYHEKEDGVFQRKKYRIRIYNHSDQGMKLEKKEKIVSYISKITTPISFELYNKIMSNKLTHADVHGNELLTEFYSEVKINRLRPRILVDYVREPYIYQHGNVRITFDQKIQTVIGDTKLFGNNNHLHSIMNDEQMILEVKYDDYLPEFINNTLTLHHHQQVSASKFVMCCEAEMNYNWKEQI